ncbi:MAG: ATP-binding protein [bacterium]
MLNFRHLLELNELAREDGKRYPKKRGLYSAINDEKGKHIIGIVGPRGVGKTIILKQMALNRENAFYLSLDTIEEEDLFDVAKTLSERYGVRLLLLDEIHFQKEYEKKLKTIFDFLDIKVIFSSSVALSILESSYDLSRRVKLVNLYPFAFREYLFFKKNVSLPHLTLDDILNKKWDTRHLRYEFLFEDYLKGGLMPFSLEEPDIFPLLENIIQKIIRKDIPSVASLKTDELFLIEKTLKFIGKSDVDGINYSSVSRNVGITKYKAESYIQLLEKAFVLNVVFPIGTNVLKEPKVLMCLPLRLLYQDVDQALGGMREDFFAEMMRIKGMDFHYLKTRRGAKTPDFLIKQDTGDIIVEIGGKSKGREQFKGIPMGKKLILSHPSTFEGVKRPLFLLGFI